MREIFRLWWLSFLFWCLSTHTRLKKKSGIDLEKYFIQAFSKYNFVLVNKYESFTLSMIMLLLCAAMTSWVGCLLRDLELFILFAENSQIFLKISLIPILLTFMSFLVALKQPTKLNVELNSSLHHIIVI